MQLPASMFSSRWLRPLHVPMIKPEDLELLFSFPVDRVDQECRHKDAPKYCSGQDEDGKLVVLRSLLPFPEGRTAEAILCFKHMDELMQTLLEMMRRRDDGS